MESLLEKTRRINRLLQRSAGTAVDFNEMAEVLSELLGANVYVASRKGKILGSGVRHGFADGSVTGAMLPEDVNNRLMKIDETTPNTKLDRLTLVKEGQELYFEEPVVTIVPIGGGGERLGTLILGRSEGQFGDEELILAELGATVVGMEILRAHAAEMEEEARKKAAVQVALGTLSYSELEAVQHIFDELEGNEGLLVASKIADRVGITRSVIVNALRKFESAGVIESRSLGMKGTHIKVLNDRLIEELRKMR
ncbi:GTP-sensing pleiotropic transcriptional regulator CodY [Caldinitratiruptor microaerophilus]|uniref:Global transcriptional regulator CodY n=1 Tax=Caldinitratiruptor microaerophilus TaxID=671077 RepID=A0AA35G724_9FIRM|nr:GTP-sensing pleiotropic transcriptional regulator CodY [Caldinitratiruptor microaerophilus]BDG59345.1 GTP-sensing transcriptional pleiotropic repressor CodY [Caldinitratiruptor microaerophilus]